MTKPAPLKQYTEEELKNEFDAVARDITNAHIHYTLYKNLQKNIKRYERELYQSRAFWGLTFDAHLQIAIASLARAFDNDPKGANLYRLIEKLQASTNKPCKSLHDDDPIFPKTRERRLPTAKQFKKDMESVTYKDKALAYRLLWHRNNIHAHKNLDYAITGKIAPESTLTFAQLQKLLKRADRIINKYSTIYIGHHYGMELIGDDDYQFVLKALRTRMQEYDRKRKAEIAGYRRMDRKRAKLTPKT